MGQITNVSLIPEALSEIYTAYLKKNPARYLVCEPPRVGAEVQTLRLYNPATPGFVVIGTPCKWRALAKKLDVTKNWTAKTSISDEVVFIKNENHYYLVPGLHAPLFAKWGAVNAGGLYQEDQYDLGLLSLWRSRAALQIPVLLLEFPSEILKPRRKGRPKKQGAPANGI